MQSTIYETTPQRDGDADTSRQQLLQLARRLDTFGRHAEQFLRQQLDELELAVEEFEREKAAWRRQLDRESSQLARQWEEIRQQRQTQHAIQSDAGTQSLKQKQRADHAARQSREAPFRLLLQPNDASSLQVGLLIFEISKLNREMGGRGLRFEVDQVRGPARRLFGKKTASAEGSDILELSVFSEQPLSARGTHVVMDVDITDRVENWIAFKSRLVQSTLVSEELVTTFRHSRPALEPEGAREILREATRRVDDVDRNQADPACYTSSFMFVNTALDTVQQQVGRMESCYERLTSDTRLLAHVSLHELS